MYLLDDECPLFYKSIIVLKCYVKCLLSPTDTRLVGKVEFQAVSNTN